MPRQIPPLIKCSRVVFLTAMYISMLSARSAFAEDPGVTSLKNTSWKVSPQSDIKEKGEQLSNPGYDSGAWLAGHVPGTACVDYKGQTNGNDTLSPELIIRSGFEADTAIYNMNANILGFQGVDHSVAPPNSWKGTNFYEDVGHIYCQLGSPGSVRDRSVSIVSDPQNPTNHALMFQINNATERGSPVKGRVSMNIGENKGLKEIYYRVRLMLPSDFGYLRDYTFKPGNWLTLMEFWENPDWTVPAPYPFRVTLYVVNSPDHANLNFGVEAQTMDPNNWKSIWRIQNKSFNLPFNEWFTMEVYYKEGDNLTGRFWLSITRSDGKKTVIFDVKDYTYHPSNPTPAGLKYVNPMKLYCSKSVVDWVSNRQPQRGILSVYWDDFELWKNKNPSELRP